MFKESIVIAKISGIPIRIHVSFLIILPFLAWVLASNINVIAQISQVSLDELMLDPYIIGLFIALSLFASVAIHELAHSFVARSKGIEINNITLMLFGGVAQLEEMPENPDHELRIAIAGPFASLILGVVLMFLGRIAGVSVAGDLRLILTHVGYINIFLAIFNLMPAFPTDGGRVLRAFLAKWTSFLTATRIATGLGRAFAFLFGIFGFISGNFILIFIAFFVFIGASQEFEHSLIKATLSGFKVRDLMTHDVSVVDEDMTIDKLFNKMFEERHSGYPVVSHGALKGCVTMEDIRKIDKEDHYNHTVGEIMSTNIKKVRPDDDIYDALKTLSQEDIGRLMVVDEESKLVGIITRTDIIRGFKLQKLQDQLSV